MALCIVLGSEMTRRYKIWSSIGLLGLLLGVAGVRLAVHGWAAASPSPGALPAMAARSGPGAAPGKAGQTDVRPSAVEGRKARPGLRGVRWWQSGPQEGAVPADRGAVIGKFHDWARGQFQLKRVVCSIDDTVVYDHPTDADSIVLFRRALRPGPHTVAVGANYDGDPDAVFAYMEGYHFDVSSARRIVVPKGETILISIVGHQRRRPSALGDRPALSMNISEQPVAQNAPGRASKS